MQFSKTTTLGCDSAQCNHAEGYETLVLDIAASQRTRTSSMYPTLLVTDQANAKPDFLVLVRKRLGEPSRKPDMLIPFACGLHLITTASRTNFYDSNASDCHRKKSGVLRRSLSMRPSTTAACHHSCAYDLHIYRYLDFPLCVSCLLSRLALPLLLSLALFHCVFLSSSSASSSCSYIIHKVTGCGV